MKIYWVISNKYIVANYLFSIDVVCRNNRTSKYQIQVY